MYPPSLGNSTLMVSLPAKQMEPVFEDLNLLFATTAYRGVFNAEFKLDSRDGQFKLIEINARPWWYIEFAAVCGVDVCSMMYRDAMGLPVETAGGYTVGRRCVLAVNDFLAWRQEGGELRRLWGWTRPWWGAVSALFHWSDPGPGARYGWRILRQRFGKTVVAGKREASETMGKSGGCDGRGRCGGSKGREGIGLTVSRGGFFA
jgi:predicted ATP-grasp superfamily ATP-dependent carboligase